MGLIARPSEFLKLEVEFGSVWRKVPGIRGYSEIDGASPERDETSLNDVGKRVGFQLVPSLEMSAAYLPIHDVWKKLSQASLNKTTYRYRLTTKGNSAISVIPGKTAAISPGGGETTFSESPDFSRLASGLVLRIGLHDYVIDDVDPENQEVILREIDGTFPSAAVLAGDYSVRIPSLRRGPFSAAIRIIGSVDLEQEGNLSTDFSLSPRSHLPDWEIAD